MRPNIKDHAKKPKVFIQPIGALHMAALKANVAELRGRIGKEQKSSIFMRSVVRRELGEVVAASRGPALGELKLQPAHKPPALNRID